MYMHNFQSRVEKWMLDVFGKKVLDDKKERVHRFLEEALELAQSLGYTQEEAKTMVDYVYGRPVGEPFQEIGGTLHCLSALCTNLNVSMGAASANIIEYCEERSDAIREKHRNKPDSIASNKNYENNGTEDTVH